jgi:hypothetical protein
MYKTSFLAATAALMLGICTLPARAATDTITINATLGPILSGTDPAGANNGAGTITIALNELAKPSAHTTRTATYTLRKGTVTVTVNGQSFTTTGTSTLKISLAPSGDTMELKGHATADGVTIDITGTAALATGSFPRTVLKHPKAFSPSPQNLTAATSATGPGSKLSYSFVGSTTVLGLAGTASN